MKRILAMALSVMLVATLAISGTVAYFTDDESEINTMTVGSVNITLLEHQRILDDNNYFKPIHDSDFENFEDDKNLMPITGDGNGKTDKWNLSKESNYEDKIVRVTNNGESDAWVRIFIAVPSALEDVQGHGRALWWDSGKDFVDEDNQPGVTNTYNTPHTFDDFFLPGWDQPIKKGIEITGEDIPAGTKFNIYCFTSNKILKVGETTPAAMVGFYLDENVDYKDDGTAPFYFYLGDKEDDTRNIKYDLSNEKLCIPVFAQAIQAEGFKDAKTAFSGKDGEYDTTDDSMPYNPWAEKTNGGSGNGGNGSTVVTVDNAEQLMALFQISKSDNAENLTVELTSSVTLKAGADWTPINLEAYKEGVKNIVINGNHHTISGLNAPLLGHCYFGNTSVEINDLTLSGCNFHNKYYNGTGSGAFVAAADNCKSVTLTNCHLTSSTITSDIDCTGIGGLIGFSSSPLTITNCSVTDSTITGTLDSAGAIAGHVYSSTITNAKVIDCTVKGESSNKSGYVVGTVNADTTITTNSECANNTVFDVANSTTIYGRLAGGGTLTVNGNPVT